MTNDDPFKRAINDLSAKISERMSSIREDQRLVNKLCEYAGLPACYPNVDVKGLELKLNPNTISPFKRRQRPKNSVGPLLGAFIISNLNNGSAFTLFQLKELAISSGIPGLDRSTKTSVFQGTLLGLKARNQVVLVQKGLWKVVNVPVASSNAAQAS